MTERTIMPHGQNLIQLRKARAKDRNRADAPSISRRDQFRLGMDLAAVCFGYGTLPPAHRWSSSDAIKPRARRLESSRPGFSGGRSRRRLTAPPKEPGMR